jgi:hypothetical protein
LCLRLLSPFKSSKKSLILLFSFPFFIRSATVILLVSGKSSLTNSSIYSLIISLGMLNILKLALIEQ